ncbi:unnamed protein product [Allacma fusca]|uniref:F-box domain-containing protein n=1 Tax=Allacma fusca TaxID=39272 RepID=A0A8J2NVA9_9HEXA|nr:unnamed protein product [Allacma fusca]
MLKYFLSLACLSALCFNGIGGTEEHSNIIGAKGEQEFLDNAIHLPKARLYTKENLTGEFEDPKSFGTNALRCANLDKGNGTRYFFPEVKSVDTFGTCVRIYEGLWCEGLSLAIYPGSPFTHNISLSNLQTIKSISPCLQNEFENAQIESNSLGYRIFKDPKRTQSLDIVPDEIPFFSPINTTTIYPQCGIIQQERGFQNRVEYVKIEIERDTLRSDEVVKKIQIPPKVEEFYGKLQKEEGDVLGWAVPLELGGPVEEMNAFPLNRNVREEFQRVVSKVNGIFGSNESIQRVHFSVNFVYFDENSTRPDAFSYWIIQDYGEGANYYDLLRNSVSMNLTNLTTDADQKLIETALNHPKGRIEFSREGSITDVLEFDTSNSSDFPRCQNFIRFQDSNETFTVKSFGTCIRLFQYSNCRGKSVAIYPGSSVMATDVRTKDHDDYRTVVLSIGPCLLQEFKHSKVIELNGTTVVVKDTSLFKDLTSIPDVLFDISGDDRVATFVRCPIRQVSLKYDQIIEFMMTAQNQCTLPNLSSYRLQPLPNLSRCGKIIFVTLIIHILETMEPPLKRRRLEPIPRNHVLNQIENWMLKAETASPVRPNKPDHPIHINKVLDPVFKYLDVKRLKICRLVSKVWNTAACGCLKNSCAVRLSLRAHTDVEEQFSKVISAGAKLGLPFPFKFYHLDIQDHFKHTTRSYLNGKSGYIENFHINLRNSNEDYILESNFRCLTHLSLFSFGPLTTRLSSWKPNNLVRLRTLTVSQNHSYFSNVFADLVSAVLNSATELKQLKIINCDSRIISPILTSPNLAELEHLTLDVEAGLISGSRDVLEKGSISKLKSLMVQSVTKENDPDVLEIIKLYSASLEELSSKFFEDQEKHIPECPLLRALTISDWRGSFAYLKPDISPSLETVTFRRPRLPRGFTSSDPHEGVSTLRIVPGESDFDEGISSKEFQTLLNFLTCQFPKVRSLVFEGLPNQVKGFENDIIGFATQKFPKLESFSCLGYSWDLSKDGRGQVDPVIQKHYQKTGKDLMSVPVKLSLCGWTNLIHLDISNNALTHRDILSITFMPALKSLEFYWNKNLTATVVAKLLKDLTSVRIKNCCETKHTDSMEILFTSLTFLQCGCKRILTFPTIVLWSGLAQVLDQTGSDQ